MTLLNTIRMTSNGFWGALAGLVCAGLFAFVNTKLGTGGDMVTAYLGIMSILFIAIPLYMVTLSKGPLAGVVALITGVAGMLALGQGSSVPFFVIIHALPAVVFSSLALMSRTDEEGKVFWFPEGYLVTGMSIYPCLLFLGAVIGMRNAEGGLKGKTLALLQEGWTKFEASQGKDVMSVFTGARIDVIMENVASYMPSSLGIAWMTIAFTSLLVAQWLLKTNKYNRRAHFSLTDFLVPSWVLGAVAVTGGLGYLAPDPYGYIGANLCVMFCVPFFFLGLAVIHIAAERWGGKFLLGFVYFLLIALPWFSILVALIGTLDIGLGLRQRMAKPLKLN